MNDNDELFDQGVENILKPLKSLKSLRQISYLTNSAYSDDSIFIADRVGNCIDRVRSGSDEKGYYDYVPFVGESEGGNGFQNVTVGDVLQLGNERLGVYISKVNENIYAVALFGNPEMAFYNSDGLILDDNFEPMEKDNRKIMGYKTSC